MTGGDEWEEDGAGGPQDTGAEGGGRSDGGQSGDATVESDIEERADVDVRTLSTIQSRLAAVREEVAKRIVGQEEVLDQLLVCLLCDGNALLESNPGLGKTLMVRTIASVMDLEFARIQNTPDLMPSDITGTEIIRESDATRAFVFEKGPVFANVVLADEINRATPKTQAALLEAMQEKQVTAYGETYPLPRPFFLLATQNPIDLEGTYPLPEAQSDRFLLKILVGYPSFEEEAGIVDRYTKRVDQTIAVDRVLTGDQLQLAQELTRRVPIADDVRDHAIEVVRRTRESDAVEFGASPRASMGLVVAAKARAFLRGGSHVTSDDVDAMAPPVLRHRLILDFQEERQGRTPDDVVEDLL